MQNGEPYEGKHETKDLISLLVAQNNNKMSEKFGRTPSIVEAFPLTTTSQCKIVAT
jgi:hypothetical protein